MSEKINNKIKPGNIDDIKQGGLIFFNGHLCYVNAINTRYLHYTPFITASEFKYNIDIVFHTIGEKQFFRIFTNTQEMNKKDKILISRLDNYYVFEYILNLFNYVFVSETTGRDEKLLKLLEQDEEKPTIKKLIINRDFINIYTTNEILEASRHKENAVLYYDGILNKLKADFKYNYLRVSIEELNISIDETTYNKEFKRQFLDEIRSSRQPQGGTPTGTIIFKPSKNKPFSDDDEDDNNDGCFYWIQVNSKISDVKN